MGDSNSIGDTLALLIIFFRYPPWYSSQLLKLFFGILLMGGLLHPEFRNKLKADIRKVVTEDRHSIKIALRFLNH